VSGRNCFLIHRSDRPSFLSKGAEGAKDEINE
jgi:hypothetical protein